MAIHKEKDFPRAFENYLFANCAVHYGVSLKSYSVHTENN